MDAGDRNGAVAEGARSPFNRLQPVAAGAVRWTEGFWADEFEKCRSILIPGMHDALRDPRNSASLANFAKAGGLQEGDHIGCDWSDGNCYNFLEAATHIYSVTGDEELAKVVERYVAEIGRAQEQDGYVNTSVQLARGKRWKRPRALELFNLGHLMTAACVHYRSTGKDTFLKIAIKAADLLCEVYEPRPKGLVNLDICPANIMGAVDLYRTTLDRRYLQLAQTFVDMRGTWTGGSDWDRPDGFKSVWDSHWAQRRTDWSQTRTPLGEEKEAVGHAVEAAFLWFGAADLYSETGEATLIEVLKRMWESMTQKKMYVTGGIGAWHDGLSPHRDYVGEAFAKEYELPNRTAYNETCANIAGAMFSHRMLNIIGEAKYADQMETALYNSVLSAKDLEGKRFFYTNPLARAGRQTPLLSQDTAERFSTFNCYCCPPELARTIAGLHGWAYGVSEGGVWVHIYGGSELSVEVPGAGRVGLRQETGYPWDGSISFTMTEAPGSAFSLMLRIPGWSDGGEVRVNGAPRDVSAEPGTYAAIRSEWKKGDTVQLDLPMRVKAMRAHPLVEEARGRVCITRGPVVYCLESVDLPPGVGLDEVYLPARPTLTPRHCGSLLGGVTVLEGSALRVIDDAPNNRLYREASWAEAEIPLTLVPYYAWCNRGPSEMSVWLPVM